MDEQITNIREDSMDEYSIYNQHGNRLTVRASPVTLEDMYINNDVHYLNDSSKTFIPDKQKDLRGVPQDISDTSSHIEDDDGVNAAADMWRTELFQRAEIVMDKNNLPHVKYTHLQPHQQPGDNGTGLLVITKCLSDTEKDKYDAGWENNAYNEYASDKISVHRTLPDIRHKGCPREFPTDLPDTSVIMCFHNEGWSALLRSIHSVLDKSPPHLMRELILVDDFSNQDHLKKPLENYIYNLEKVKLIRTKKREGLIRARLLGYSVAEGKVLTFLDSHIECYAGWLEPLLASIAKNWTTVVWPHITIIDDRTFAILHDMLYKVGVFSITNLQFNWDDLPEIEKNRRTHEWDPIRTPAMAGGLFSIDRMYFRYLGTYDNGMEIWGGENIEISLRVWMCGGSVELIPCSHVGHIFRRRTPYKITDDKTWPIKIINRNRIRYAEVWLDDYKNIFYERINYKLGEFGDVSERRRLKERLKCHSFDWYIKNVYPTMDIPEPSVLSGEVRLHDHNVCLSVQTLPTGVFTVKVNTCHGQGIDQFWALTNQRHIYAGWDGINCLNYNQTSKAFQIDKCSSKSQLWTYKEGRIVMDESRECLQIVPSKLEIRMRQCDSNPMQLFQWKSA
ncbi:hypothetical protein ScPMuIL_007237 [Solemya velum]